MKHSNTNNRRLFLAKTLKTTLLTAALFASGRSDALAQNDKPVYGSTSYYHVDSGKRDEFLAFVKNTWSKFYDGLVKDVGEVRSVTITEIVYGGNPEPRGNFAVSVFTSGPPHPNPATSDPIYRKTTGMSGIEVRAKAATVCTRVGQVLSANLAREGNQPLKEGDFLRVDYMKIADGRTGDYFNMERNDYAPIHAQRIKDGTMKGWRLNAVRSPGGESRTFDAFTVQLFSSIDDAMTPTRYEELLHKATPEKSMSNINSRMQPTRKLVRGELRRVIWTASKTVS